MSIRHAEFDELLRVLDEAGCLAHVLLVGSWAEYLYDVACVLDGFCATIRTLDIDVLVRNRGVPSSPANVPTVAREHGFLVRQDVLTSTTKLVHPSGLEVEFLLGKVGAGLEASMRTNIGVVAQTLRHLDVLKQEPLAVSYEGMTVCVPCPEAYVLQKMVVNDERGWKAAKDAAAIRNLWPHLDRERLSRIASTLTRREMARAETYAGENNLAL